MSQGLLARDADPLAAFVDMDALEHNVTVLHRTFERAVPAEGGVLHAFAAKANCLVPVLKFLRTLGMGCEVASEGELAQAVAAGFEPESIVFDSPAKTMPELRQALALGVALNADNFQELERIRTLREQLRSTSRIGVRINPQVGLGGIEAMSTAGRTSKFGIALDDPGNRERLLAWFSDHPWLTMVHAHVGSQGCRLPLIADGLRAAVDFAEEVNRLVGRRQISTVDIGGGLPVDFETDAAVESPFAEYVGVLRDRVPELFDGRYSLITEFGRTIAAKYGFIAAFVEYTKTAGGSRIAITHAGAQTATRTVFMPEAWPIRVTAHTPDGGFKRGDRAPQTIAGPCCFAGDLTATNRELPILEPGDIVSLLDTGAYYFSTPFSYNSLLEPGVYGARIDDGGSVRFVVLREPQTMSQLLQRTGASLLNGDAGVVSPRPEEIQRTRR
ncbi:diaminopimelate decarboxylase [Tsukamurella asaccharolytica]|uniref:diaminopimelate decarboxylase n=1 Tax=Tsukamurella asaccharolytica TaxID=2592067 RepID=UPI00195F9911|nr:diaminopimelate decarboxylase [Tsukamurella asaccharolytica]